MAQLKAKASDSRVNLAILIHQNHDAVIAALKQDQWRYFTFGFGILATFFLRPDVVTRFSETTILVVSACVALLTVFFILRTQFVLRSRIYELAFLQSKLGAAYLDLRKTGAKKKSSLFFRIDVWGFQSLIVAGLFVLIVMSLR